MNRTLLVAHAVGTSGRAALATELRHNLPAAMRARAEEGHGDGTLAKMFRKARRRALALGMKGAAADGFAIADVLREQADQVQALLGTLEVAERAEAVVAVNAAKDNTATLNADHPLLPTPANVARSSA